MTRPRPLVPRGDPADTVRVVGEFGVIARVLAQAGSARSAEVGPGDDAAVVRAPDKRVVATTDVLVEGRHFRRDWSSPEDIGHKAAAANLADVAAMGGVTSALLVGVACPPDTQTAWLEGVAAGLAAECAPLGAAVVGGDLVAAASDSASVVISVTALGDLYGRPPVLRSGARPGDVVALAGRLGWSACGLAVLRRGFSSPIAAVAAHRRPDPALRGRTGRRGRGGARDVRRQRRAARRPRAHRHGQRRDHRPGPAGPGAAPAWTRPGPLQQVASALGADPMSWVLTGGEDHALVATFPPRVALPEGWTAIGAVRAVGRKKPGVWVNGESAESVVRAVGAEGAGHVHFG